jgi:hypothetical protein
MNKFISLLSPSTNDDLFKKKRKWILDFYRDDNNKGFVDLRKELKKNHIEIHTNDFYRKINPDLEMHFTRSYDVNSNIISYLFLPEAREIIPENDINNLKKRYYKIFCQYDRYVDNKKVFKLNYPYNLHFYSKQKKFNQRNFACIITSNKNLIKDTENNLYPKRYSLIKWYEKNYFKFLHSYGEGWNEPPKKTNLLGRVINYINKLGFYKIYYKKPKNYLGSIASKKKILINYKFSFCFENCSIDGYFSDIIFDSMNAGSIPVYLGSQNVTKYIPQNCFINFRNYDNFESLHKYLISFDENDYLKYIFNIKKFYRSSKSNVFKNDLFLKTLKKHLIEDLKLLNKSKLVF